MMMIFLPVKLVDASITQVLATLFPCPVGILLRVLPVGGVRYRLPGSSLFPIGVAVIQFVV